MRKIPGGTSDARVDSMTILAEDDFVACDDETKKTSEAVDVAAEVVEVGVFFGD